MSLSDDTPGSAAVALRLHGYPALLVHGRPARLALKHAFGLIALLADASGRLSRAAAAACLWPDAAGGAARARLRRLMHELNRRLGVDLIGGDTDTVCLHAPAVALHCDWLRTRRLARRAVRGEPLTALQAAPLLERHAEHLLDGFSLPSDAFDDWLDGARREHASLVARALRALALQWLELGDAHAARTAAQRLVAIEPCSEAAHACLLAAHASAGDAAGVELAYFECAALLRRELGIRPSALLEDAYASAVHRCRGSDRAPSAPF